MKTGTCRLCLSNRELAYSHIIPEFFYEALYDDKHRILGVPISPVSKNYYIQKGAREYLLCTQCELKFSKWEDYSSKLFKADETKDIGLSVSAAGRIVHFEGVRYREFKLLQLSILWRSCICSLPIFKYTKLGHHQEKIRQLLLNEDPGRADKYPCVLIALLQSEKEMFDQVILEPKQGRVQGSIVHRFLFGAMLWHFFVTSHRVTSIDDSMYLTEDGCIDIFRKHITEVHDIRDLLLGLRKDGRFDR